MPTTVPMHVADVRDTGGDDPLASHVVLLEEEGGPRRLPIWIGAARGHDARRRASTTVDLPRPDTYRFAADLLAAAGARLREVRIVRLAEMIFYAQAVLEDGASVDARPSDAINLALVTGAPVLVEEAVLAQAADERARDRRGARRGARLAPRRARDRRRAQGSRSAAGERAPEPQPDDHRPHQRRVDPHPRAVEQQVGDEQERGADGDREEAEAGDQQRVGRLDQPLAVALVEAQPVRGRRRDQAAGRQRGGQQRDVEDVALEPGQVAGSAA